MYSGAALKPMIESVNEIDLTEPPYTVLALLKKELTKWDISSYLTKQFSDYMPYPNLNIRASIHNIVVGIRTDDNGVQELVMAEKKNNDRVLRATPLINFKGKLVKYILLMALCQDAYNDMIMCVDDNIRLL